MGRAYPYPMRPWLITLIALFGGSLFADEQKVLLVETHLSNSPQKSPDPFGGAASSFIIKRAGQGGKQHYHLVTGGHVVLDCDGVKKGGSIHVFFPSGEVRVIPLFNMSGTTDVAGGLIQAKYDKTHDLAEFWLKPEPLVERYALETRPVTEPLNQDDVVQVKGYVDQLRPALKWIEQQGFPVNVASIINCTYMAGRGGGYNLNAHKVDPLGIKVSPGGMSGGPAQDVQQRVVGCFVSGECYSGIRTIVGMQEPHVVTGIFKMTPIDIFKDCPPGEQEVAAYKDWQPVQLPDRAAAAK